MKQRTTTTTMCDGCGREGVYEYAGTYAMTGAPPGWASIYSGNESACVCSPACGTKVLTAWWVSREAASTRGGQRGEDGP